MKEAKEKSHLIFLLIIIALLIRVICSILPGFKIDVDTWFAWVVRLTQVGPNHFYTDQIWTNYTPGYLYVLYLLGLIKNAFSISDNLFYLILKLPAILSEITLGILIFNICQKKFSAKIALMVSSLIFFNPALIFNSSVWGQIDGILTLFLLLSIYYLEKLKIYWSAFFVSVALLIKPQAVAIFPILLLFFLKSFSLKKLTLFLLTAGTTLILGTWSFFPNQTIYKLSQLFLKMTSDYPHLSLFAFNLWGVVEFWTSDTTKWFYLSYQQWGTVLVTAYWLILSLAYLKKKINLYSLAALACLGFYFLPTRVHERYLYPAIPFLVLSSFYLKSKIVLLLTALLSLIHLLNLYFVYVYYNEFFLNLPKTLYQPVIYNFLSTNTRLFSLLSTIIFIVLSILVLKNSLYAKNNKP